MLKNYVSDKGKMKSSFFLKQFLLFVNIVRSAKSVKFVQILLMGFLECLVFDDFLSSTLKHSINPRIIKAVKNCNN